MNFTGYINYNERTYTFHYKDDFLTLIIVNPNKESQEDWFYGWNQYEKVEYFKGFTSDGFEIYFYINDTIRKWNGTYRCFPKIMIISKNQKVLLSETKYKTLKFTGGIVNKFYSNRKIFDNWVDNIINNRTIKFKNLKETVSAENICIDSKKAIFEISVTQPGLSDNGSIKIGNIDSIIRIIYKKEWKVENILNSVLKMRDLFFFCLNRRYFSFDKISLEIKNEDDKYVEVANVYIPNSEDIKEPKYMLSYQLIEGNVNKLLKILDEVKYITYKIPKDDKEYTSVTATSYANTFSAFQSIYNYCNKNNILEKDIYKETKAEIIDELIKLSEKYRDKNGKKRKIIKRYINLIDKKTDFKLETMINNELNNHNFILESLPDQRYKDILENSEEVIIDAVESRDLITHDDVFAPRDVDIAVYLVLERLIHILILKKIGVKPKSIIYIIQFLNQYRII